MQGITITQFLIEEQRKVGSATGEFTLLLNHIVTACKRISCAVNKGALVGTMGSLDSENVQGETQKQLDVITNDIFLEANQWAGYIAGMASEEMDDPYDIPERYLRMVSTYAVRSTGWPSNVNVNITVGTIFSILRSPQGVTNPKVEDFLQQGTRQVCAGYALYGSSTMLVLTTGHGVNGFTLDREVGEFFLTNPDMQTPVETSELP